MGDTKFICPKCQTQLVMTKKQSKPHCPELGCGFVCRRTGHSMVMDDKRMNRVDLKLCWDRDKAWGQVRKHR